MAKNEITSQDLKKMLSFVAGRIEKEEAHLNSLDAAIGDGDHGITMRLGFQAIRAKLNELDQVSMDMLLVESGLAFMGATGGAIGVVLGKMLMAAGKSLKGKERMGSDEFKILLCAMESSVSNSGKIKCGDKTILDALSSACQVEYGPDPSLTETISAAAAAAESGARKTSHMVCRVGRASRLGDRTLGHPDPGALSFSLILHAMADWLHDSDQRTQSA
ncbi:MAG TPA: dihydroxyacetone kinase subunit DhaL [Terriglobia bacterium]|nr:dihydroxyacetone kinase subunit DhaL [Terriglobia bacterium]